MPERAIIHLNVAYFAVAVERVIDSRLQRRPVIIAPENAPRARVYDMSDEAYRSGIRKGMTLGQAKRLCRDAILQRPHPERYRRAMRAILKRILPYSPLIEKGEGDGHLFVDVTGTHRLFGPPPDIAWRIRCAVFKDLDLDPIWSVASNKLVAKVATRLVKPRGEYIVAAGEETAFLRPLPMVLLPGLLRSELVLLRELNLSRAAMVEELSLAQLSVLFDRRARFLHETVRGIDSSAVLPAGKKQPQVGFAHKFSQDTNDMAQVRAMLYALVEKCGFELRKQRLAACRLGIFLSYSDGVCITRQAVSKTAIADNASLSVLADKALDRAWLRRVRLTSLRLSCDRLMTPSAQLLLFTTEETARKKQESLMDAIDSIRCRFGENSIRRGSRLITQCH